MTTIGRERRNQEYFPPRREMMPVGEFALLERVESTAAREPVVFRISAKAFHATSVATLKTTLPRHVDLLLFDIRDVCEKMQNEAIREFGDRAQVLAFRSGVCAHKGTEYKVRLGTAVEKETYLAMFSLVANARRGIVTEEELFDVLRVTQAPAVT